MSNPRQRKIMIAVLAAVLVAAAAGYAWLKMHPAGPGASFVSGNGRIEATEIDIATKMPGRVQNILVNEGDFVAAGQVLAHMQVQTLDAQRDEALAQQQQSLAGVANAAAQIAVQESNRKAAMAMVAQKDSELDAAQRRLDRSEVLATEGASSQQELDDDRARVAGTRAAAVAARAQVGAAEAAVAAARTQLAGAHATVTAAGATVARVSSDIEDTILTAPREGRVQYRIAEPGEVLGGGGKVLNLLDLNDVYMTFFVPEAAAGRLALGGEVHLILDAAPQYVIPASISYVASVAQFTPKTVETASERQKLMFRVKARIDRGLLQKYVKQVKTGLPGIAWVKLDPAAAWPAELATRLPQ